MPSGQLPRTLQPPPELPDIGSGQSTLANYLRTFSLWCRHGFADKISGSTANPEVLLQAYNPPANTPPTVWSVQIGQGGGLWTTPLALGGGERGTPVAFGSASWLPLTGGTITGNLSITGTLGVGGAFTAGSITSLASVLANGYLVTRAVGAANAGVQFLDNASAVRGYCYWNQSDNTVRFQHQNNTTAYLDGSFFQSSVSFSPGSGAGYRAKAGINGAFSNIFNINWITSTAQLWIDGTNIGNISTTSDYRTKKDVQLLGSTWDQIKALKPISYTQKDYGELIKADDVERWGFIAHELQETLIESAANGHKDCEDEIQSPNPWTVIAALTKAVQELQARVEELEAR